ncbi:MAG: hypothetical protein GY953_51700, partial [bacterium]|nr:hypothetical protein [bacterium]
AAASHQLARNSLIRKHEAWAHKLFGDIAVREERLQDARREYDQAVEIIQRYPCPTIQWRILSAAAGMAKQLGDVTQEEHYRGWCRQVVQELADSILDDKLRRGFLHSKLIRDL